MHRFYSQHGEDYLLELLFAEKNDGCFVEVGCIDGSRFSNTLHFEEKGWSGLCIEAHGDYIGILERNRPNSQVVHCAVGEANEDKAIFYANARGSLSTLDKTKEEEFKTKFPNYFTGFKEQIVKKKTLNSIFTENGLSKIDLLSLDIEGYEIQALQGLDLGACAPEVIVVESDSRLHEQRLDEIIIPRSYVKMMKLVYNIFYVKNPVSVKTVNLGTYVFPLTNTCHPLDSADSCDVTTEVSLTISDYPGSEYMFIVKRN